MLRRIHLFEFHDLPWFPRVFREALTEWLRVLWERMGAHKALAPVLAEVLHESGATQIVDLCSGGGGPLLGIQRQLQATAGATYRAILTDRFPSIRQMEDLQRSGSGLVETCVTPVDATLVPGDLRGFRTLFNSFHHFRRPQARKILSDAYHARQPIGIFEIPNRTAVGIAFSFIASFVGVFVLAPKMQPKVAWWIITYLVPVIPFVVAWDGWVSHLRAYTPEELLQLTSGFSDAYRWETRKLELQDGAFTITCLLGVPEVSG